MIPFLSLAEQTKKLKPEILRALEAVIDEQGFANGPAVAAFEKELAAYLGCKEVVCVNTGTTALHAALLAAGVGAGDDVVTVAHTWISTAWAVSYVGARPVFCDVSRATCGMDAGLLDRAITPRTKAILPVHLYGNPLDMAAIAEVASKKGLPIIEDCAQSIGATLGGRQTGTFGLINATSFYPGKNLGAYGEGGAVMTNDAALADRVRCLRDHAQRGRHNHVEIGFNWRLDGFQGAVLRVKLAHLDAWNARRRAIAARYHRELSGLPGLTLLDVHPGAQSSWHIYPVFHARRDDLRARLEKRGVQTGVHYPKPVHLQPAYAHLGLAEGSLPASEWAARSEASLPMFPELTDEQAGEVIAAVREVAKELA